MNTSTKRKLNNNSVDFHINESVSTRAHSQQWEEPISLRKGSEQLHTITAKNSNIVSLNYSIISQHFEGVHSDYGEEPVSLRPIVSRKRLYSQYERINTDTNDETKIRADDYLIKYKTEICKNFEFKGSCKWGDTVN